MNTADCVGLSWIAKLLLLASLISAATVSITHAQDPYQRLARRFELPELGLEHPIGVAYSPAANALLVATSFSANALRPVTFAPDLSDEITLTTALADPLNMAFDGRANSLLFWDAAADELVEIGAGSDGRLQSGPTRFNARAFGLAGARGLTVDPQTGDLFALVVSAKSAVPRIVRLAPTPERRFAGPSVSSVAFTPLRNEDLQGIAFNPNDGHLYVMAPSSQKLYELNLEGAILSTRDVSKFRLRGVRNMVFAPSGDQTDDPEIMNLYLAESGLDTPAAGQVTLMAAGGSGDIAELSLTPPEVLDLSAITVQTSLVQTILTSEWSPPSPDPAGLAYYPPTNGLLISDSEVDEVPIYAGKSLWQVTLNGAQVQEFGTASFSDEPSGVAYNPNNQHLFFTDDTGSRRVYELDPGPDGLYDTPDDVVTSFRTNAFFGNDPEGITYDTFEGHLFIVDGSNAEVYEIDPGANGIFDGVPPAGDDVVDQFDTSIFGLHDPEGIDFNTDTGTLFIVSREDGFVVETTRDGSPIRVIDVAFIEDSKLAGIAYAPTSNNPSEKSLYFVDRGSDNDDHPDENDGKIYEVSLGSTTPSIFIDDLTFLEGDTGTLEALFRVTLSTPTLQTVTVDYSTADGSATTLDNDYVAVSGQLNFSPLEVSRQIMVTVNSDTLEEGDETFFVNLSNATFANIADNQGIGTITEDDGEGPIVVSFKDGINGYAGTRDATLLFDTPATNFGKGVEIEVDGSPDIGGLIAWDLTGIPTGNTVQSVDITINVTNESGDDYELYEVKRPWVETEATWNQYASGQNWQVPGGNGSEDKGSTVLGVISSSVTGPHTISLNAAGVAAVQGWLDDPSANHGFIVQDYVSGVNGLGFASREATLSLRPQLTVTLAGNSEPSLAIADTSVDESAGTMSFTVTMSSVSSQAVTVDYATADSTAQAGSDYTAASGTLTIPVDSTSGVITVPITDDALEESSEIFKLQLSNPSGATLAEGLGLGTIVDDDAPAEPVTVSFQDGINGYNGTRDVELDSNLPTTNFGSATVLKLDGTPSRSVLLSWDVSSIPAGSTVESAEITFNITNASSDTYEFYEILRSWIEGEATWNQYAAGQSWQAPGASGALDRGTTVLGTITGPKGLTTVTLNAAGVAVVQAWVNNAASNRGLVIRDHLGADDELDLSSRENNSSWKRPMLTVTYSEPDGSGEPSLTIADASVDESAGTLSFTVTMSLVSSQAVTVDYATADSTAQAGSDYTAASGTLTIPVDSTSGVITVPITDDALEEASEIFKLQLSNPSGATIADGLGLGTIVDDDAPVEPVTVSFQDGVNGYSGTRDVELDSNLPTTNFGSATVLKLDGTPSRSVLLSWDVSSIPTGSTVESAEITFNITNASSDTYEFYEILRSWIEGEATWNQYAAGQSWQTPGASGSLDRGSTMLGSITGPKGLTTAPLNAAGVAVVQAWVNNAASNRGLVIRDHLGADDELDLSSHENNSSWKRPMLSVTYSEPGQGGILDPKAKTGGPELAKETLPKEPALNPNYPNPFREETNIEYALSEPASVHLAIYNIRGQLVSTLVDELQPAGFKQILWDGTDDAGRAVGSGVYLIRMLVDRQQFTGKMILMK